jgi:cytochrome c
VLGPLSDNVVRDVGTLADYACSVDIAACEAPRFAQQPTSVTVAPGGVATFSAVLAGGPSIQVQWLRDGQPVDGGGTPTLSVTATAADDGARFSLRAENAKGLVFSDTVTLTVSTPVDAAAAQALAQARGCFECHSIDRAGSGPAWRAVAQRYAGVAGAQDTVAGRILNGSSRNWGPASAMSPQPVSAPEAGTLAAWILSLK